MLDTRTLMLVLLISSLVLAVVMTLVSLNQRQYPGPRCWAGACWLIALGVLLFLLRGHVNQFFTVVVANVLFFAAFAILSHGLHRFLGLPPHDKFYAVVSAAGAALVAFFVYVDDNTAMRVVVFGLTASVVILHGASAVLRHIPAGGAWAYRFAGGAFGVAGLYQLLRAVMTPWVGHPDSFFGPSLLTALNAIILTFSYICLSVGLVMMLSARLSADLHAHMADLRDEIGIRRQAEQLLAREATLDYLTGAANRRKLFDDATRALALARRHGRPLAVVMLDLDHFKEINDRHGHEVGDQFLKALARLCQSQLRQEDTFARYGGEEFVILLPEADATQATILAERLRAGLADMRVGCEGGTVGCTCSFGVTQVTPEDANMEAVLRRADQALYLAKDQGRDQIVLWRQEDFAANSYAATQT